MLTKSLIEKYFIAEKNGSFLLLIIGLIAIIAAFLFILFLKNNFWRGAAMPLLIVGFLQIAVGYTVYNKSDSNRINIVYAFDLNPSVLKNSELPRMQTLNKKFIIYKWVEICLIIIGLGLVIKFKQHITYINSWNGSAFWLGIGLFLTIQSIILITAGYFAEKRTSAYTNQLIFFTKKTN